MSADTSTQAVERLAHRCDNANRLGLSAGLTCADAAVMLRALAAERDAMREALDRMIEAAEIMASGYGRIDGKTHEDEDLYLYERGHDVILAEAAEAARAALKGGAA